MQQEHVPRPIYAIACLEMLKPSRLGSMSIILQRSMKTNTAQPNTPGRSTKVLFPRFEYETPEDAKDINETRLVKRTVPRPWLPKSEVELILNPLLVVDFTPRFNAKGKWWGVSHTAVACMTQGDILPSPYNSSSELFRTTYAKHDYEWDHQYMEGSATEIVLERLPLSGGHFEEIAAMLIYERYEEIGRQHFVTKNVAGEWQEPYIENTDYSTDFHLVAMRSLSTNSAAAANVTLGK